MNLQPYLTLARLDNWTKNLLMAAGVGLAYFLSDFQAMLPWDHIGLVFAGLCLASSANYVLNETLDAESDRFHPIKKNRPAARCEVNKKIIALEYGLLVLGALALSYAAKPVIIYVMCAYLVGAWIYNIPPVRVKDKAYADVLLESINYPIRILLGWCSVLPDSLPPSSVLITAWTAGAFAMTLKRLAEYRLFNNPENAARYRKSYAAYSVDTFILFAFIYGMVTMFGITIFMLKYKIELVLLVPLVMGWMGWYFLMGLQQDLCVIYPERWLKNKIFLTLTIILVVVAAVLLRIELPWLHVLLRMDTD